MEQRIYEARGPGPDGKARPGDRRDRSEGCPSPKKPRRSPKRRSDTRKDGKAGSLQPSLTGPLEAICSSARIFRGLGLKGKPKGSRIRTPKHQIFGGIWE